MHAPPCAQDHAYASMITKRAEKEKRQSRVPALNKAVARAKGRHRWKMRAAVLTSDSSSSLRSCHHRREHAIDRFAAKPVKEEIGTSPMLSITVISSSEEACQYLCVCVCV